MYPKFQTTLKYFLSFIMYTYLKKTDLLTYNLHTLKFTLLKCTIQWFFSTFTTLCIDQHYLILEH